jgi:hypothetical protein
MHALPQHGCPSSENAEIAMWKTAKMTWTKINDAVAK